jgi:hypothetical protein
MPTASARKEWRVSRTATIHGGGTGGEVSGVDASVTGGSHGKASYRAPTVLGGLEEVAQVEYEVTP